MRVGVGNGLRVIFVIRCWRVVGAIDFADLFITTHYSQSLISHASHLPLSLISHALPPPTNSHYSSPKYSPKFPPYSFPSPTNSPSAPSSHYSPLSPSSSNL